MILHNSEEHLKLRLKNALIIEVDEEFHLCCRSGQIIGKTSHSIYHIDEMFEFGIEDACERCGNIIQFLGSPDGRKGVLINWIPE